MAKNTRFYNKWDNPLKIKGEIMSDETKTEQTGYVPPKVRIEEMIRAGIRLAETRREMYDGYIAEEKGKEDFDENDVPLVRRRGFDTFDAINAQREAGVRLEQARLQAVKDKQAQKRAEERQRVKDEVLAELKPSEGTGKAPEGTGKASEGK